MKVLRHRYTKLCVEILSPDDLKGTGAKWEDGGWFALTEPFHSEYFTDREVIRTFLAKGFVFNMRSGPALVDLVLPKVGAAGPVWAAHDGHYNSGGAIPRSLSDGLLSGGLSLEGFAAGVRALGWAFVRLLGGSGFRSVLAANKGKVVVLRFSRTAEKANPIPAEVWDEDRKGPKWKD